MLVDDTEIMTPSSETNSPPLSTSRPPSSIMSPLQADRQNKRFALFGTCCFSLVVLKITENNIKEVYVVARK